MEKWKNYSGSSDLIAICSPVKGLKVFWAAGSLLEFGANMFFVCIIFDKASTEGSFSGRPFKLAKLWFEASFYLNSLNTGCVG